jgi:hypothetical protein
MIPHFVETSTSSHVTSPDSKQSPLALELSWSEQTPAAAHAVWRDISITKTFHLASTAHLCALDTALRLLRAAASYHIHSLTFLGCFAPLHRLRRISSTRTRITPHSTKGYSSRSLASVQRHSCGAHTSLQAYLTAADTANCASASASASHHQSPLVLRFPSPICTSLLFQPHPPPTPSQPHHPPHQLLHGHEALACLYIDEERFVRLTLVYRSHPLLG